MNKIEEIIFNLKILEIKVIRYSQFELLESFDKSKFPLVEFQTSFDFKVIEEEDKINSIITIKIKVIETNEYFAELIVQTSFFVSPIKSIVTKAQNGNYDVKGVVLYNIATVSLSTIRGILFERLKGSDIQKEVYPLADLSKIFLH
ncbi:hypothetical protein [Flavobacterium sp. Arc2]|uniref:hypothetical protein n=1 Tax=Flavobacterium sp. Arc2 TaxID=3046685 RepID=UPI00352C10E2